MKKLTDRFEVILWSYMYLNLRISIRLHHKSQAWEEIREDLRDPLIISIDTIRDNITNGKYN